MTTPTFAVVGHPNKGKSSIVATLVERDDIAIASVPGTTTRAHRYEFRADGEVQYVLIDTPGFQRASRALRWLTEHAQDASERRAIVEAFVREHADQPEFSDECAILQPILAGAGILYVVDGSKPFGREFELEMQILQWTGQPRMALINMIGEDDHQASWKQALGQYFSIVRTFDAMRADYPARLALLRAFAELDEAWRTQLEQVVATLTAERRRRLERAALEIAHCLIDCLAAHERTPLKEDDDQDALRRSMQETLMKRLRGREARARRRVMETYRHDRAVLEETSLRLHDHDLFAVEAWELFGLSREKLIIAGAVSGAVAGGGLDLLVGGTSLMMGSLVGGLVGGVGAWFGGDELAKFKILGEEVGGKLLQVGPIEQANFPWVLLGRAVAHHRVVRERNHARREAVHVALESQQHMMDGLSNQQRTQLSSLFARVRKGDADSQTRTELHRCVIALLESDEGADE